MVSPWTWAQEGDPKVYRIKRSGETSAPSAPVSTPKKEASAQAPENFPQANPDYTRGTRVGPVVPPPQERAKHIMWEQNQKRPVRRYKPPAEGANYLDHSTYSKILKKFVNKHGWVDYRSLKRDKWAMADLKAYVEDLSRIDPSTLEDPLDRLAAWLNLYNSLVLFEVLKHYPVKNIMEIHDFFGKRRFKIGKKEYSFLDIEGEVFKKEIREPRAILARVNGASDGPRLLREAFQATTIDKQLDERVFKFLMDRNNVIFDPRSRVLILNPTLQWYQEELGDLFTFLRTYLDRLPLAFSVSFRGYDWKLNDEKLH